MRFYCLFSALILLFQVQIVMAQDPVYRQFTNQNGLPSSEVYDVLQDKKGYMWFSTDQGLARFDGYRFMVYDESVGLPENTVFDLELDAAGNIWVNTIRGHLAKFNNDTLYRFTYNNLLDSLLKDYRGSFKMFDTYHVDDSGTLQVNIPGRGVLQITEAGDFEWKKQKENAHLYELRLLENNKIFKQDALLEGSTSVLFLAKSDTFSFRVAESWEKQISPIWRAVYANNHLFLSINNILYVVDNNGNMINSQSFPSKIQALYVDSNGDLWLGTVSDGIFHFGNADVFQTPANFLKRLSVSSFFMDNEKGVWITTLNKGVFYIPVLQSHFYNRISGYDFENVIDIETEPDGTCWLGLNRGRIARISPSGECFITQLNESRNLLIDDLEYDLQTASLWVGTSENLNQIKWQGHTGQQPIFVKNKAPLIQGVKNIFIHPDGNAFLGHHASFSKFDLKEHKVLFSSYSMDFKERVEDIASIDDRIYLATLNGAWEYNNQELRPLHNLHPLLGKRITELAVAGDTLLIGTKGNGLVMLTSDTVLQFDQPKGMISNAITVIEVFGKYIYVGTNSGISIIERGKAVKASDIQSFNVDNGLYSNEINGINVTSEKIYLATANGLHRLARGALRQPSVDLPIYVTGINVNNKSRAVKDVLKLPFSENNIQLDYFALSYRNTGHQTYRHRMLGLEDNWVVNQKTNAQYPYLPAGSYVFEVSVQNGKGEWNPESARVEIVILQPYWSKMWFILLVLALLISFLTFLFLWRIRVVKRRNQLIYDINWYQQEALINQMNPHFLFNSLNTVHRYVLQNDRVASSRYLTRFATLMRKILDMSQEKSLTIAKEIDALKLYLELESARFKDKFQFAIEVDASIPQEQVLIPVFIIQPIVENAIWHGLMHSDRHGEIKIHFYRKAQNDLVVSIRDNGIGREEAEKLQNLSKTDQRKSLGLAIIKRRIALINTQEKTNISISYNDLKAADGSCSGTEVIVHFPNFLKSLSHGAFQSNSNR